MLTKDLVKFKRVKSRIIPDFLSRDLFEPQTTLVQLASKIAALFVKDAVIKDIDSSVEELRKQHRSYLRYINSFYKILLDEVEVSKDNFWVQRLNLILKAQDLREKMIAEGFSSEGDREYLQEGDELVLGSIDEYKKQLEELDESSIHPDLLNLIDERSLNSFTDRIGTDIYKDHPDRARVIRTDRYNGMDVLGLYNLKLLEYFLRKFQRVEISFKASDELVQQLKNKAIDFKIKLKSIENNNNLEGKKGKPSKKKQTQKITLVIERDDGKFSMDNLLTYLFLFSEDVDTRMYFEGENSSQYFIKLDYCIPYKYYNFKKVLDLSGKKTAEPSI